jgi:hypothetical protein
MKLNYLRKHIVTSTLFRVIVICLVIAGASLYTYAQNQTKQEKTVAASHATKQAAQLVSTPSSSPVTTPSSASTTSTTTQSVKSTPVSPSAPAPQVSVNCTAASIPFKIIFVSGTGPYTPGNVGISRTCTYSDGRPAETTTFMQPDDQINYMNVSSADYGTAANICKNYPEEYFDACMQVIWHP